MIDYFVIIYALIKLYLVFNIYQQAHYQFKLYLKHFFYNFIFYDFLCLLAIIFCLISTNLIVHIVIGLYLILYSLLYLICKVKLQFTKRIRRLYLIAIPYSIIVLIPYIGIFLGLFIQFSIIPLLYMERILATILNYRYIKSAKIKFNGYTNHKIRITGSYGKTSTKHLLNYLLNIFYKSSCTPKSYNTMLGLAKYINELRNIETYDYLVLEFGASHKDDIKKLANAFECDVAFLTGIGHMHIDTFKNIDNVINEKMQILKDIKVAVLNYDCEYIRLYPKGPKIKILSYGINNGDYRAINIDRGNFDLYYKGKYLKHFSTNLVGKHQILNLTGILAYLDFIGCNLEIINKALKGYETVENRLKCKKIGNRYILDDAFNSNYNGFIEALNVLKIHQNKRILISPGIVELGKYKKDLYNSLLNYIVDSTDIVILIGYFNTKHLYYLLKKYNKEVYVVRNFMEGYRLYLAMTKIYEDSMLLIENDLPDLYRVGLI